MGQGSSQGILPFARACELKANSFGFATERQRFGEIPGTGPNRLICAYFWGGLSFLVLRNIFDHGGIGLVLIGMPGIEKRLARYPQFYSRIGFGHEFRPLGNAEIRQLLGQRWTPPGVKLPERPIDSETIAAIIRMTGGNFRLLNRLLTQIERILEINALDEVTKTVVEAARESLVIGQV